MISFVHSTEKRPLDDLIAPVALHTELRLVVGLAVHFPIPRSKRTTNRKHAMGTRETLQVPHPPQGLGELAVLDELQTAHAGGQQGLSDGGVALLAVGYVVSDVVFATRESPSALITHKALLMPHGPQRHQSITGNGHLSQASWACP